MQQEILVAIATSVVGTKDIPAELEKMSVEIIAFIRSSAAIFGRIDAAHRSSDIPGGLTVTTIKDGVDAIVQMNRRLLERQGLFSSECIPRIEFCDAIQEGGVASEKLSFRIDVGKLQEEGWRMEFIASHPTQTTGTEQEPLSDDMSSGTYTPPSSPNMRSSRRHSTTPVPVVLHHGGGDIGAISGTPTLSDFTEQMSRRPSTLARSLTAPEVRSTVTAGSDPTASPSQRLVLRRPESRRGSLATSSSSGA